MIFLQVIPTLLRVAAGRGKSMEGDSTVMSV